MHSNNECDDKRKLFYDAFNLYRLDKSVINRQNLVSKRTDYENRIHKARYNYDEKKTDLLVKARLKNAKFYTGKC